MTHEDNKTKDHAKRVDEELVHDQDNDSETVVGTSKTETEVIEVDSDSSIPQNLEKSQDNSAAEASRRDNNDRAPAPTRVPPDSRTKPWYLSGYAYVPIALILATSAVMLFSSVINSVFDNSSDKSGVSAIWIAFGVMMLANISLAYFVYVSFKWRTILSNSGQVALVPERWGAIIEETVKATKFSISTNENAARLTSISFEACKDQYSDLLDGLIKLQDNVDRRDDQIRKLEEGYDRSILKRYLTRLIRIHRFVAEIKADAGDTAPEILQVSRLLDNALEDGDITVRYPEVGSDSRKLGDLIEDSIKVKSSEEDKNWLVRSVITPAYIYDADGVNVTMSQARVEVYQFEKINEGEGE